MSSEQVDIGEAEFDEMWAIDHKTGVPLAYCFGTRKHKYLKDSILITGSLRTESVQVEVTTEILDLTFGLQDGRGKIGIGCFLGGGKVYA